ncbi:hypothetical protein SSP24_56320 [Streptomyces spinoverrucosus]|uniref:Uncharacterized protein n=1 Tax=Streptomyces spinoverrucosus TaxID=284043 RepID=A0A4Y3VMA4_9ACTN|nr:hypothetical protein SSP24_56320 [Streptomyces spinoverrucosus]GHB89371.1 hypothetical protein GCM10010397_71880 [Streptomyces spinoverrucosus]
MALGRSSERAGRTVIPRCGEKPDGASVVFGLKTLLTSPVRHALPDGAGKFATAVTERLCQLQARLDTQEAEVGGIGELDDPVGRGRRGQADHGECAPYEQTRRDTADRAQAVFLEAPERSNFGGTRGTATSFRWQ